MVAGIWNYFWFLRVLGKYLNYYDLLKTVMFHRRTHQSRDDCDWMYLEASSNNLIYIIFLYLSVKDNLAPVEFGYNWWWGIWEGSIDLEILECIRVFFILFLRDHFLLFFFLVNIIMLANSLNSFSYQRLVYIAKIYLPFNIFIMNI